MMTATKQSYCCGDWKLCLSSAVITSSQQIGGYRELPVEGDKASLFSIARESSQLSKGKMFDAGLAKVSVGQLNKQLLILILAMKQ